MLHKIIAYWDFGQRSESPHGDYFRNTVDPRYYKIPWAREMSLSYPNFVISGLQKQ